MRCFRVLSFFVLQCILLVSCRQAIDGQFDELEQEISVNPTTAYEKLSRMESSRLRPESRRARYALLTSLAMDKAYVDVKEDSLIQIAVRYYTDHGDARSRMLAFYSLGRVQRNAGNNAGAIVSFLQAKELAENIPDWHYLGLSTRNMAELYLHSHDYDRGKYYYQKSSKAFREIGEEYYAVYSLLGEAESLMAQADYDLADSLLLIAERYAQMTHVNSLLAYVIKDRALVQISPEKLCPENVILYYRKADTLGFPASSTVDFGTIAFAFESMNQIDSAGFYMSLAEKQAKSRLDSTHLFNLKYRLFNHRMQYEAANQQLKEGTKLHNRLVFDSENQQLANAISNYSQQEAARQAVLAKYRLILLVLCVITVLALVCVIVLIIINRKRQIKEKNRIIREKEWRIEEDIARIQEINEELQTIRDDQSEMAKTINDLIGEKIAIVKICADSYEALKARPKENPRDPYRYLDEDPVKKKTEQMQHFLLALDNFRKDDALFNVLEESVNKWRDNIMVHLRESCSKDSMAKPLFSEDDYRILMLFYAGIPDRTIAFLMDMTCAAIRTRKTRYKERLVQADIPDGAYFAQELALSRVR